MLLRIYVLVICLEYIKYPHFFLLCIFILLSLSLDIPIYYFYLFIYFLLYSIVSEQNFNHLQKYFKTSHSRYYSLNYETHMTKLYRNEEKPIGSSCNGLGYLHSLGYHVYLVLMWSLSWNQKSIMIQSKNLSYKFCQHCDLQLWSNYSVVYISRDQVKCDVSLITILSFKTKNK